VPSWVGVPDSVSVLGLNVTPSGSAPFSEIDGVGVPAAVTVKLSSLPPANVVLLAEVIAGASSMLSAVVPEDFV